MNVDLPQSWKKLLANDLESDYFKKLSLFIDSRRARTTVYPKEECVFTAFKITEPSAVKVVILGQDPYHEEGQAHGLAFSVRPGIKIPPSLRNIFKELKNDLNIALPTTGSLKSWAKNGVFLLNTVLTVEKGRANSHKDKGWEKFTDSVIRTISNHCEDVVFMLWGTSAQKKETLIDKSKHHILKTTHPSPLSSYRGFIGCRHFSVANDILKKVGKTEINWRLG